MWLISLSIIQVFSYVKKRWVIASAPGYKSGLLFREFVCGRKQPLPAYGAICPALDGAEADF
jgi:hypothetical protein